MQFFLISDNKDTYMGMRMAGIEGVIVHEAADVEAALAKAVADPQIGLVLITAKLVALCRNVVYDYKLRLHRPLIVEVSDRHGDGKVSESITRYVQEAVGLKL